MKKILGAVVFICLFFAGIAFACTGAKQEAMGHAGITICDNAHAIYWNQGMLPMLRRAEISYAYRFGDTGEYRYGHTVSLGIPYKNFGFGLQYVDSNTYSYHTETVSGYNQPIEVSSEEDLQWLMPGVGYKFFQGDSFSFSAGGSIMFFCSDIKGQTWGKDNSGKSFVQTGRWREENHPYYNASILATWSNLILEKSTLRVGCMWQWIPLNLRPGASYTFQNQGREITLAMSVYDALNKANSRDLHLGAEIKFDSVSLRGGVNTLSGISAGLGYEIGNFSIDTSTLNLETFLIEIRVSF